jgi:hypothetical protein
MIEPPRSPEDLAVQQVRVYYDPSSGDVKHVHTLVASAGEQLDTQRIDYEMAQLEGSLKRRYEGDLEHLVIETHELQRASQLGNKLKIDLASKRLVVKEAKR